MKTGVEIIPEIEASCKGCSVGKAQPSVAHGMRDDVELSKAEFQSQVNVPTFWLPVHKSVGFS